MNTTAKGDKFEDLVVSLLKDEIKEGKTFLNPNTKIEIFQKKKYFSAAREKDITFDIAIEVYQNPNIKEFTMLILIECKDYKRNVGIEELNKFLEDIRDLTDANFSHNIKPIMVVKSNLQESALNKAKNRGIGLIKIKENTNELEWVLNRTFKSNKINQQLFASAVFCKEEEFIFNNPSRMLVHIDNNWYSGIADYLANKTNFQKATQILYLSKDELQIIAMNFLDKIEYAKGSVPLDKFFSLEELKDFILEIIPNNQSANVVLGEVNFTQKIVKVYQLEELMTHRDKFTLAHELSHILLKHETFLDRDIYKEKYSKKGLLITDDAISRIEFQANYLASCILLPKNQFQEKFFEYYKFYKIRPKGKIILYKDNQECNKINVNNILTKLSRDFDISKTVVEIRLKELGLLQENL